MPISVALTNRCTFARRWRRRTRSWAVRRIVLPSRAGLHSECAAAVSRPLVIIGQGRQDTTILAFRSQGGDTMATMISTVPNSGATLHLTGLTLQGTRTDSSGIVGSLAGLRCDILTTCILTSVIVEGQTFEGIAERRATVTLTNSIAGRNGIGIVNESGGNLTVNASSIGINNRGVQGTAFQGAGGLVNLSGATATINTSTIIDNTTGHPSNPRRRWDLKPGHPDAHQQHGRKKHRHHGTGRRRHLHQRWDGDPAPRYRCWQSRSARDQPRAWQRRNPERDSFDYWEQHASQLRGPDAAGLRVAEYRFGDIVRVPRQQFLQHQSAGREPAAQRRPNLYVPSRRG